MRSNKELAVELGTSVALPEFVWIVLLGIVSGLMIGCIGIGGVILVPALVFLADMPIQIGIPAAMFAYILSGLVATAVFAHNKSIRWAMAAWLCLGAHADGLCRRMGRQCRQSAIAGSWPRLVDVFVWSQRAAIRRMRIAQSITLYPTTVCWSSAR